MTLATLARGEIGVDELQAAILRKAGLDLHPLQAQIAACLKRFILTVGGEQSGKSWLAAAILLLRHLEQEESNLLYWLVGADYSQTEREFTYIADGFDALGMLVKGVKGRSARVDPGRIRLIDGTRIETKSATDARRLTRESPNGIIVCEASLCGVETWERVQGRATPRSAWVFMSGTFEKEFGPWFRNLSNAWKSGADDRQSFSLPTWTNLTLFPGGRNDPKILDLEEHSSDEYFMERIGGEAVPPRGIVFPEFRVDLHIRDVNWRKDEPVYLWEDPGYGRENGAHAVYAVHIRSDEQPEVEVFAEIYERGKTTEEIIDIIVNDRIWWKAAEKHLVSDPYYKDAHHSMNSVGEQWLTQTGLVAYGERTHVAPRNERLKGFLKPDPIFREPRIVFSPRCVGILSEFGVRENPFDGQMHPYRYKMDRDGTPYGDNPKDEFNHGIDAVTNGLVEHFGFGYIRDREVVKQKRHGMSGRKRRIRREPVR